MKHFFKCMTYSLFMVDPEAVIGNGLSLNNL